MSTLRTICGLALLLGCGSPAASPSVDEAFRRIQAYEATIAHRAGAIAACTPVTECEAERDVCSAVEGLCTVSRSIDDPDALRRCELARPRCPEAP